MESKHLLGGEGSTPLDQDRRMMGSRDIEATMFVPHTPGEELRKRLQAKEDKLSRMFGRPRVKIIERVSTALENLLSSGVEIAANSPPPVPVSRSQRLDLDSTPPSPS